MNEDTMELRDHLVTSNPEKPAFAEDAAEVVHPDMTTYFSFRTWRIFVILLGMSPGFFVQFHCHCSNVAATDMSIDYEVELERMSIFASGYFYSFAFMQLFVGLLCDMAATRKIICFALVGSALSTILTSFATSLIVGALPG
jgi:sugar phosphate permease